jgi:hypothetical protein
MSKEKAITMSQGGLNQWKYQLQKLSLGTATDLMNAVCAASEDGITPPTARRAFKGGGVSQPYWERIFTALDLSWKQFFSQYEWKKLTSTDVWKQLLAVAEDANDRFGLVLSSTPPPPPPFQQSDLTDAFRPKRYKTSFCTGAEISVEFPYGLRGFLILLGQGVKDGVFNLAAPSCLMPNTLLKGNFQRLPQYPPAPIESISLTSLGTFSLWAGIFDESPQFDWLSAVENKLLSLELEQLDEILEFSKSQPQATIWRSSYTVTTA